MTWTYSADPMNNVVDEVHFLTGDTDATDPLLQNEEIEQLLVMFPKPDGKPAWLAAAAGCDAIAAKFGREMDRSVGSLQQSAAQKYDHYVALAQQLRVAYATQGAGIIPSAALRVVPAVPRLGGGGATVLGDSRLTSGGGGYGGA